jgi:hypothetical protein
VETIVHRSLCFAAIGLLASSGCFSGGYDTDYAESVARYRQESEFQRLHKDPKKLLGGRLQFRFPKLFGDEDSEGTKEWSKPPILKDFTGARIGYRFGRELNNEKPWATLTVWAVNDQELSLDGIKTLIRDAVRREPVFSTVDWQPGEPQADGGGTLVWSVLKLAGQQPFDRDIATLTETKNTEGETQIWVSSTPESKVSAVLVWRVPQELAAEVPVNELASLVSRTVELTPEPKPAPAAAAPEAPQEAAPAAN